MRKLFLLFLLISKISFAQVNLSQGLVAYYPFNGNANDASGNNINGVTNNVTLTADRNGIANSAYYFSGTNTSIQLPFSNLYNFAPTGDFSIAVWIQPDLNNTWPAQAIVIKSPYNSDFYLSNWNYGIYCYNYKMMSGYASNNFLNGTTTFSRNQCWYHLVLTYTNRIWKIYVNGSLEGSDNSQTNSILQDNQSTISFGKKGEANGDFYEGKMDEIRIYNRVLNQQEIDSLSKQDNPCSDIVTPVIISSFNSTITTDNKVKLNWQVEEEIGITKYIVQRSTLNSNDFISIGTINAHKDNKDYLFIDNTVEENTNYYYRLQIIENTGQTKYSAMTTAKVKSLMDVNVYPNPTKGYIKMQLNNYKNDAVTIKLYDQVGKLMKEYEHLKINNSPIDLNVEYLPKGNYILVAQSGTYKIIRKIIKI